MTIGDKFTYTLYPTEKRFGRKCTVTGNLGGMLEYRAEGLDRTFFITEGLVKKMPKMTETEIESAKAKAKSKSWNG